MKKPSKKLIEQWDKKLAKAGFVDAEDRSNGLLKRWDSSYYQRRYTPQTFQAKARYYELATIFYNDGFFENGREKEIWRMHAEGLTYREIAAIVKSNKDAVNAIIAKYQKEAGIKE